MTARLTRAALAAGAVAGCLLLLAACGDDLTQVAGAGGGLSFDLETAVVKIAALRGKPLRGVHDELTSELRSATGDAYEHLEAQLVCVVAAQDREAVHRCMNEDQPVTACAAKESHCEGELLVNCDGPGLWTRYDDCSAAGLQCVVGDGVAGCGVGTCPDAWSVSCNGNIFENCWQGVMITRQDCAELADNPLCVSNSQGGRCGIDNVGSCPQEGRCLGDMAVHCSGGGLVTQESCPDIDADFACVVDTCPHSGGTEQCSSCRMPPATEQCADGPLGCDGTVASYCSNGKIYRFDCALMPGAACSDAGDYCSLPLDSTSQCMCMCSCANTSGPLAYCAGVGCCESACEDSCGGIGPVTSGGEMCH